MELKALRKGIPGSSIWHPTIHDRRQAERFIALPNYVYTVRPGVGAHCRSAAVGLAAAQLAGQDFLVGLDRQRDDAAGQQLAPVPGLCSTTAAGLARRFTDGQWRAVEAGIGDIHARVLAVLAPQRAAGLCESVTIDLDTTDVEVYGRHKRGMAYNHQGQGRATK